MLHILIYYIRGKGNLRSSDSANDVSVNKVMEDFHRQRRFISTCFEQEALSHVHIGEVLEQQLLQLKRVLLGDVLILDQLQLHVVLHELFLQYLVLVLTQALFDDLFKTDLSIGEPTRRNSGNEKLIGLRIEITKCLPLIVKDGREGSIEL